ncbi:uncharacterized protein BXZ73DRAFT_54219, partial [Epithele typhae]|uniref:uncharacterized protein n=1 Tax=Epithele typhae TaxID=378194 RepID=UPI0020082AB9
DYAQDIAGGTIAWQITSFSAFAAPWSSAQNTDPRTVLNSRDASHCWAPPSLPAQIGVRSTQMIHPTHIIIDTLATDPEGRLRAPKNMHLWGAVDGKTNTQLFENLPADAGKPKRPTIHKDVRWVLLGSPVYDIHNRTRAQSFPLSREFVDLGMTFGVFALEIMDNWGAPPMSTCLSSVWIYGTPP